MGGDGGGDGGADWEGGGLRVCRGRRGKGGGMVEWWMVVRIVSPMVPHCF